MHNFDLGTLLDCPVAAMVIDNDLTICAWSEPTCLTLHSDIASLKGQSLISLFTTISADELQHGTQDLRQGKVSKAYLPALKLSKQRLWFDLTLQAIAGSPGHFCVYIQDVSAAKKSRALLDAYSTNLTLMLEEQFHLSVCQFLSQKLEYEFAIIGKLIENDQVQVLGAVGDGEAIEPFVYNIRGTPCQKVVGLECCVYPRDVQTLFPEDIMLQEMGVESYIGSPLFDSKGNAIGLVAMLSRTPILDAELAQNTIEMFSERISSEMDRQLAYELLSYQASHDVLCDIPNRRAFQDSVDAILLTARNTQNTHSLCYIDLDQFKIINDSCGHAAGDELLKQLCALLQASIPKDATIARLGGDEFGVLLPNHNISKAKEEAERWLTSVNQFQFIWEELVFRPSVSIGVAEISQLSQNVQELLKRADTACYVAKEHGRNCVRAYQVDDSETHQHENQLHLLADIDISLANDRFVLFAQAIKSSGSDPDTLPRQYEILLRKLGPEGEIIAPFQILSAAERYNAIQRIDQWVIRHSFEYLAQNPQFLEYVDHISINLSGQSLTSNDISLLIKQELARYQLPASKICFEITETAAISRLNDARNFINDLKTLGFNFSLDDFGTGLSSLSYLKHLPVDYLKIDGSFVKEIALNPIDRAMVKSVNEMGHVVGMKTIAEFVENDTIKNILNTLGVDYVQGYGIEKPMPFTDILAKHTEQRLKINPL